MRTGKSLIGMAVVGETDGTQLGRVRDLIFDHGTDQLLALVMDEKDLFGLVDAMHVPCVKCKVSAPA